MLRKLRKGYLGRLIRMNALRKGLLGGHPFWRFVWFAGLARRLFARVSKRGEAPVTFSEELEEGEAWSLVHVPERSRRGRRLLEAPSAERINAILGRDAVSVSPPTRRQRRRAKCEATREST